MRPRHFASLVAFAVAVASALLTAPNALAQTALAQVASAGQVQDSAYRLRFDVTGQTWPQDGAVNIVLDRTGPDSGTLITLSADEARFVRIQGGREATPVVRPFTPSLPADVVVKRDQWVTALVVNGALILRGHDGTANGGEVGVESTSTALTCEPPLIQPFSELNFASNFATDEPIPSGWEVPVGGFQTTGLKHNAALPQYNRPPADPRLAANPFSYAVTSAEESITTTGYWFWDSHDFRVAAKSMGPGEIGLCAYYQDPRNFVLFSWAEEGTGAERKLTLVRNGERTQLASAPGGFQQIQWYQLGIRACDGYLEATIDGQVALKATVDAFMMGQVGLYGRNIETSVFDDVSVRAWRHVDDDFQQFEDGKWVAGDGLWEYGNGALTAKSTDRDASVFYGDRTWRDYEMKCRVLPAKGSDAIGVYLNSQDDRNYYLFRWNGDGAEPARRWKRELVRCVNGTEDILAQTFGGDPSEGAHDITASVRDGVLRVDVDDEVAASAGDSSLPSGRVGFYTQKGDGTRFDQLTARFYPPPPPPPSVTEQFTQEATMSGWASPGGLWSAPAGAPPVRWFEGVCFGDAKIKADVTNARSQRGTLSLILNGDRSVANSGYAMAFTLEGPEGTSGMLSRRGQPEAVAKLAPWPEEGDHHTFRFQRRGKQLAAYVDDHCILSLRDETPIEYQDVGLAAEGVSVSLEDVIVQAPNMLEYTFSEAPTDWFAGSGTWEIADRWQCFPGWAWLCGYLDPSPTLWSKRTFSGDQVLEVYCAMRMDLPEGPGYDRPSDLNVTICGDGVRRDSGYSLIFAGWNPGRDQWSQAKTALLKGDQIVAERTDVKFSTPTSGNMDFHRHWFHIQFEKRGDHVLVVIDGQPVFDYQDPTPLPSGRVAFWSYKNGVMLARVRMAHEDGGEVTPFPPSGAQTKPDIPFSLYE